MLDRAEVKDILESKTELGGRSQIRSMLLREMEEEEEERFAKNRKEEEQNILKIDCTLFPKIKYRGSRLAASLTG
jgi:hypothetical protein